MKTGVLCIATEVSNTMQKLLRVTKKVQKGKEVTYRGITGKLLISDFRKGVENSFLFDINTYMTTRQISTATWLVIFQIIYPILHQLNSNY